MYSLGPDDSADRLDADSEDIGGAERSTGIFAEPEIGADEGCPLAVKGIPQLASVRFSDGTSALYSPDVFLRSAMLSNNLVKEPGSDAGAGRLALGDSAN